MIEGVIHHCTEMEVDRQYVDSHGQSTVAFAFCRLLGFELLPCLETIRFQKLYRPDTGRANDYPRLQRVLTRAINWELVRQHYDQMVRYATALRLEIAETEAIVRRDKSPSVTLPDSGRSPQSVPQLRALLVESHYRLLRASCGQLLGSHPMHFPHFPFELPASRNYETLKRLLDAGCLLRHVTVGNK